MGEPPGLTLTMSHLYKDPMDPPSSSMDWNKALGNMESAAVALDTFRGLMADAVFLDEDAYTNAATLQNYQSRITAQARRINTLEGEVAALRGEVEGLQTDLAAARDSIAAANSRIQEQQSELDSNAVVFDMHYAELLAKNEEITRLKAIIEGLGSSGDITYQQQQQQQQSQRQQQGQLSFGPG